MPSPILARADALMHRKRLQDGDFDDVPVLTDAISDDIPVLTDSDLPELAVPLAARESTTLAEVPTPRAANNLDPDQLDALAVALSNRLEQRLRAELPRLIDATIADFMAEYTAQPK